jgi:sugar transferase (PEP-CTERM/EpsH1 system associated)
MTLDPPRRRAVDDRGQGGRIVVGHVVHSLEVGGLENIVLNLVAGLDPARFDSVIFCLETTGDLAGDARVGPRPVVLLNKRRGVDWRLWIRMARSFRKYRVDVVHCHNYGPLVYGSVGGRLARARKVVYTSHGPEASARRGQGRILRLGLVDDMIAISEHVRRVAIEESAVDPSRIKTIYNGVDLTAFSRRSRAVRERVRSELGVGAGDPVVGVVARLTEEKDHATLLRAFARVLARHACARLLLVGDGELRGRLAAQSAELGVDASVSFLGTRADVGDLLSAFDVFVLPSKLEGLGITLLEAMAAGLPSVGTDVGGIPEIVAEGKTGRIVPQGDAETMADAIIRLIENAEVANAMGEAGRARAHGEFSVERMVRRYEAVYTGASD